MYSTDPHTRTCAYTHTHTHTHTHDRHTDAPTDVVAVGGEGGGGVDGHTDRNKESRSDRQRYVIIKRDPKT